MDLFSDINDILDLEANTLDNYQYDNYNDIILTDIYDNKKINNKKINNKRQSKRIIKKIKYIKTNNDKYIETNNKRIITDTVIQNFESILNHLYTIGGIIWTTNGGFDLTSNFQTCYDQMVKKCMINSSNIRCFEKRASLVGYAHREKSFFKKMYSSKK
jgi:cell wall-associated NlpC family hydrolase